MSGRYWRCYTRLRNHPVFHDRLALQVFLWLICEAKDTECPSGEGRQVPWNGKLRTLKRGEITINFRDLALEVRAPRSTIYSVVRRLQRFGLLRLETGTHFSLVTIDKYDKLQPDWNADGTQAGRRRDAGGTSYRRVEGKNKRREALSVFDEAAKE